MNKLERWKFLTPLTLAVLFVAAMVGGAWANEFAVYEKGWSAIQDVSGLTETDVQAVADGSGNTYYAYINNAATGEVYVQKINAAGVVQWQDSGTQVLDTGVALADVRTVLDSSGNLWVVAKTAAGTDLYLQKVNAGGSPTLGTAANSYLDGVPIDSLVGGATVAGEICMVFDGGGITIAYVDNGTNDQVMVTRRKLTNGTAIYDPKATSIVGTGATAAITLTELHAIAGSTGNTIIVAYNSHDDLDGTSVFGSVWGTIVDGVGNSSTAKNLAVGTGVTGSAGFITGNGVNMVTDGSNGAVVSYERGDAVGPTLNLVQYKSNNEVAPAQDGTPILTADDDNSILDMVYNAGYAAVLHVSDGPVTVINKYTIGGANPFAKNYATSVSVDDDEALEAGSQLFVNSSTSYFVIAGDVGSIPDASGTLDAVVAGADLAAIYVKENASHTDAAVKWGEPIVATVAGDNIDVKAAMSGSCIAAWTDDVSGNAEAKAFKFDNTPKYNLGYVIATTITDPVPAVVSISEESTITVKDRVNNDGDLVSPATTINYYLADANTYTGSTKRLLLGSRDVAALDPGKSEDAATSTVLTIPANNSVGGGDLFIVALINQEAYNQEADNTEADNTAPPSITISAPDLVNFTNLKMSPIGNIHPSDVLTLQSKIQNIGNVDAGEFTVKYYLTDDAPYTINNVVVNGKNVGSQTISSLAAGGIDTGSPTVTLPATFPSTWNLDVPAGSLLLIYSFVDADAALVEASDWNNLDADSPTQPGNGPADGIDFVTVNVEAPQLNGDCIPGGMSTVNAAAGTYQAGDNVTLTYNVTNQPTNGAANGLAVSDVVVKFYFGATVPVAGAAANNVGASDKTAVPGDGDFVDVGDIMPSISNIKAQCTEVGSVTIPSIANGSAVTGTVVISIPETGGGAVYMVMDPDSAIQELRETDNVVYVNLTMAQMADLIPSGVTVSPTIANQGEQLTVPFSERNIGPVAATASTAGIYLSLDTVYDAEDYFVGVAPVGALGVGGSLTYTGTDAPVVTIPSTLASGVYYVLLKANYDGSITESCTTNNVAYGAIPVTIGQVAELVADPTSVTLNTAGDTGTVTISGGSAPYAIQTAPNGDVATATLDGSILTITAVADGTTSVVIADSQVPADSVTIPITVGAGGAQNPPTETNVGLCDAACQATAPVTATGVDFSYTEGVTILVGAMDATFTQVWWLNSSCEYTTDYAEAASGEMALSCSVDAPDDAAWLFWFVTAEDLDTLNWDTGAYELLFYSLD